MKRTFCVFLICLLPFAVAFGQQKALSEKREEINSGRTKLQNAPLPLLKIENSPDLQNLLSQAVGETINKFEAKGFTRDSLAITLIDLHDAKNLRQADYRGEIKIYPASVVKLFYLVAAHRWLEDGRVRDSPELERGLHDMIVDSSNDATGYIVDVLSGVGGGAELPENEFKIWAEKRESVQRYFDSLGYQNINVKQKAFCEDAYGREQQFRGKDGINRNKLTTNATARLLAEIVSGKAVSPARSGQMMNLLKRDWEAKLSDAVKDLDDQAHGFTALAHLPGGTKLWSKAGWTSATRHDAAYIETPDGLKFVLVIFTENAANEREIIPTLADIVLERLKTIK